MVIKLVQATEADIEVIQQLAHEIWNAHYPSIIGQTQVDYMLNKMYSTQALTEQMQHGHAFLIIKSGGNNAGFLSFSQPEEGHFFIHKFYISTSLQGKGTGEQVFNTWRMMYGPKTVKLTVNRQNYKSVNFYFKLGFIIHRVVDIEIGNNFVMNDFEMIYREK